MSEAIEDITLAREDVARLIGMAVPTVRRLEHEQPQRLPPFLRVGKRPVYLRETVLEWIKQQQGVGGVPSLPQSTSNTAEAPRVTRARGRPRNADRQARGVA